MRLKVRELINTLLNFNMDLDVEIAKSDGQYPDTFTITDVVEKSQTVLLESNTLIQGLSELEEKVEYLENQVKELED